MNEEGSYTALRDRKASSVGRCKSRDRKTGGGPSWESFFCCLLSQLSHSAKPRTLQRGTGGVIKTDKDEENFLNQRTNAPLRPGQVECSK